MDIQKPLEISLDKFTFENNKDDINPYMIKKLLRKKYESLGYNIIPGDNFETSLLLEFIKKYRYLDNYSKVKLGEYKPNPRVLEYNKQVLEVLDIETIQKLLFICRICSYIGDPSFPDFLVYNDKEAVLRYVYIGDELLPDKLTFILLSKLLDVPNVKLSTLDFLDYKYPEHLEIDTLKTLEKALESLSLRVNLERSELDTGIDLTLFKSWIEEKTIDSEELLQTYNKFLEKVLSPSNLKENLSKLESMNTQEIIGNKPTPEKLKNLIQALEINMMEAHNVLNLYEILKSSNRNAF